MVQRGFEIKKKPSKFDEIFVKLSEIYSILDENFLLELKP